MAASFASSDAAIVRRSPVFPLAALAQLAPWIAAMSTLGVTHGPPAMVALTVPLVVGLVVTEVLRGRSVRETRGRVDAGEDGLFFDGRLVLAAGQIRTARFVDRGAFPVVRVERRGVLSAIDVRVPDVHRGLALIEALRPGGDRSAPVFHVRPAALSFPQTARNAVLPGIAMVFPALIFGAMAIASHLQSFAFVFFAVCLAAMGAVASLALVRTTVRIGHDGLLLSWCGRSRFIPYVDIRIIHGLVEGSFEAFSMNPHVYEGLLVTLVSGESLRSESADSAEMYRLLGEAVDGWWRREGSVRAAMVRRGPRDPAGWLELLKAIDARASSDYRNASMADELWRIVEDVAAPPDARAGAAVALRRSLGDEGRARLRKTARVTVQPALRIAIERAAGGAEDGPMIEALAEIEAEAEAEARSRLPSG